MSARHHAEHAAREHYGRLLSLLAARTRDIAAAEDALSDAFAKALRLWLEAGVPDNPAAWLLTTARNALTDAQRRAARLTDIDDAPPQEAPAMPQSHDMPDERLKLLFVCAHPAIDPQVHAPLMLQCVFGLEAADIAPAFVMAAPTLAQRLVRAKRKIRDAGIAFAVPDSSARAERLSSVCEAIYAAHALDWLAPRDALGEEALYLAHLLAEEMGEEPEALGLFALVALGHARRDARLVEGAFVPLPDQDAALWDGELEARALHTLARASRYGVVGRFQLEAAIQAVHHETHHHGSPDWQALLHLHAALLKTAPSLGAHTSYAVCLSKTHGTADGLAYLDRIKEAGAAFQPWWSTRAALMAENGAHAEAAEAYGRAIDLATEPALRRHLEAKRAGLMH